MYKNILLPVVFDKEHDTEAAFRVARALADDDAAVTVLHVVEPLPGYIAAQLPAETVANTRAELEERLTTLTATLPGATPLLATGHPGHTIISQAKSLGCDCIIMASHLKRFEDILIGSTADRVVRHARCAVHVIR